MADSPIARVASLVIAALWFAAASVSYAQTQVPTPAPTPENSSPAAEAQRQTTQPLNNAPVWREVRSGAPGVTTVRGRETNILIQPQGETWRALRVPVVFWGGMLFALALVGLGALHMIRGAVVVERKRGDRFIERFAPADRYAHWLVAITWVVMAITGLIMSLGKTVLLPLIGYTLFSWLAMVAKNLHDFTGPILIVAAPWLFLRFARDNGIGREDIRWFANIKGFFTGHEYPSGRFNAGEKAVFWLMLVLATPALIVTGLVLVFPNFDQTRSTMQTANILHMVVAYLAIALACVHIYIGTLGVTGAYRAMRDGYVDESWAEHHHKLWYEEVVAGRARQKFVDPNAVPPPATQPRTRPA